MLRQQFSDSAEECEVTATVIHSTVTGDMPQTAISVLTQPSTLYGMIK